MDNNGRLLECWLVTCKSCKTDLLLYHDSGTDMSKSQAKKSLLNDFLWVERDDDWFCADCNNNFY